jgi:hypothetical protein
MPGWLSEPCRRASVCTPTLWFRPRGPPRKSCLLMAMRVTRDPESADADRLAGRLQGLAGLNYLPATLARAEPPHPPP